MYKLVGFLTFFLAFIVGSSYGKGDTDLDLKIKLLQDYPDKESYDKTKCEPATTTYTVSQILSEKKK